jgi:hypothetical protein
MSKRFFIFIAILSIISLIPASGNASDWATSDGSCYAQGEKIASAALSINNFGLYAAFDYGVHDAISVGGGFGYNATSNLQWRYNYLPIMLRGAFHPFNLSALADKIVVRNMVDVYVGLTVGWRIGWLKWKSAAIAVREPTDLNNGFAIPREFIGVRYFFNDKLAIFVEHCPELTNISGGVSYKF